MRRALVAAAVGLAVAVGCTQDFDSFSVEHADAGASASGGTGGTLADGMAGGSPDSSTGGAAAAGSGGALDASDADVIDAPADSPEDAPPDVVCGAGSKLCNGSCVLDTNPAFGCAENACAPCELPNATPVCDAQGKCAIGQCNAGYADCDGALADGCETHVDADVANCGGCGAVCSTPNATPACNAGVCAIATCSAGYSDCDGTVSNGCETNTAADPKACGACTKDCTAQAGNWVCNNGQCAVSQCPPGTADCDNNAGNGCETNTTTSNLHCGYCGHACTLPHATAKCVASACAIDTCDAGYADCDGDPTNGCEAQLATSTSNCGTCGRACSTTGVLTAACTGGVCTSTCQPGLANCTQPATGPDDGCESNLLTDPAHCGSCARACSSSNTSALACSNGQCAPTCQAGWANCSQPLAPAADDGCETNTASNVSNCGGCGHLCISAHASSTQCTAGTCVPVCNQYYADCNTPPQGSLDNGCETPVGSDPDNCGACGRVCSSANVSSRSCALGACDSLCNPGFGNCNQPATGPDDGCEANLLTDTANCGSCGRGCSSAHTASLQCAGGVCTSACQAGYGNCTTPASPAIDDGCETDTQASAANCGACGRACSLDHASATSCSAGKCAPACQASYADCSTPAAPAPDNGCESDLSTDPLDCGACGRACGTSNVSARICAAGLCTSSCTPGHDNCSQPAAPTADNACESTDSNSACGSCANSCSAQGLVCTGSLCGCTSNSQCGGNASCSGGLCVCKHITGDTTCQRGETCGGLANDCRCNGGNGCSGGQTCCQQGGCKNLATDPANCGACGRACAPGFACSGAACVCDADADCNAGSAGTCVSGACKCGSTTCPTGQRCLVNGTCG